MKEQIVGCVPLASTPNISHVDYRSPGKRVQRMKFDVLTCADRKLMKADLLNWARQWVLTRQTSTLNCKWQCYLSSCSSSHSSSEAKLLMLQWRSRVHPARYHEFKGASGEETSSFNAVSPPGGRTSSTRRRRARRETKAKT